MKTTYIEEPVQEPGESFDWCKNLMKYMNKISKVPLLVDIFTSQSKG